jgi:hypothetical protein
VNFIYTLTVGENLKPDKMFSGIYYWMPVKTRITGSDKGLAPTGEK